LFKETVIKSDRAVAMIYTIFTSVLIFFFFAAMVDIGHGLLVRRQLQSMADAASLGGAMEHDIVLESDNGELKQVAVIFEEEAKDTAEELIERNADNFNFYYNNDSENGEEDNSKKFGRVEIVDKEITLKAEDELEVSLRASVDAVLLGLVTEGEVTDFYVQAAAESTVTPPEENS